MLMSTVHHTLSLRITKFSCVILITRPKANKQKTLHLYKCTFLQISRHRDFSTRAFREGSAGRAVTKSQEIEQHGTRHQTSKASRLQQGAVKGRAIQGGKQAVGSGSAVDPASYISVHSILRTAQCRTLPSLTALGCLTEMCSGMPTLTEY